MADELELSDHERDLILAHRTAAEAKKKRQQTEKPPDLDDIHAGMKPAEKQRIMDRIMECWKK